MSQPILASALASPHPPLHGDGLAAEIVREIDHGLADRGMTLVGRATGHEAAVELQFGKSGELLQACHRQIAASEIVDRERNSAGLQFRPDFMHELKIAGNLVFGEVNIRRSLSSPPREGSCRPP